MMRKIVPVLGVLLLTLLCGASVFGQTARVDGKVMDKNGNPYPGVTVTIENTGNGQHFTLTTNKRGEFTQLGLAGGTLKITLTQAKDQLSFSETVPIAEGERKALVINLKEIIAQQATAHPEEEKKRDEEEKAQKDMKLHFDTGVKAIQAADALETQIHAASKDQKPALQQQRTTDCQTAVSEFELAQKGIDPKQVGNVAIVNGNMGEAYECVGRFDDAATAYEKATAAKPDANLYTGLATNLAKSAAAMTDTTAADAKLTDATAACNKAAAIDPTNPAAAANCWKNVGIVLLNKGDSKPAADALQKATQADPKDAQTWLLLGNSLTALIDGKTEGNKMVYTFPPGIREAYQKAMSLAPNTPTAEQAKAALAGLEQLSGTKSTTSVEKTKH